MRNVLLASNRLPVTIRFEEGEIIVSSSAGGLASGLRSVHEAAETRWVGWPGDTSRIDPGRRRGVDKQLDELRTVPVHLSQSEIAAYYEGFANGVIWPVYLYLTDQIQKDAWSHWKTFVEVNRRFADVLAAAYRPGDLVWIHDFHLSLVPALLRERIPDARIGFFLHIPFPSSEVFRILPWRVEILKGMLGADVIGFHTYSYVRHFERSLLHLLGLSCEEEGLRYDGREIRVAAFPMGIDVDAFERAGDGALVDETLAHLRGGDPSRKLLLGVDRLDHTKGIPRRLRAVERLLEIDATLRGCIRFVQIVVPSRTQMNSYRDFRRELDSLVGRINATHGGLDSMPIHYLYRSVPFEQLVALYRTTDVMLVTPLRDGMNLVAKEFVASRVDDDGVLILSEFAGAACELAEALQVNPYDIDGVALAIKRALEMAPAERSARMRALRGRVRACDARQWADSFLQALEASRGPSLNVLEKPSSRQELDTLVARAAQAVRLIILLDYDGTLVPFACAPDIACPDRALQDLLTALASAAGVEVHVISGRASDSLERWLGHLPIALHAEHGACSWDPMSREWRTAASASHTWKPRVTELMNRFAAHTPGSLVEGKACGVAWHYRMADPDLGERQARILARQLQAAATDEPMRILWSNKTIDAAPIDVNKGRIVEGIRREAGDARLLAIGDDRTDEDMFAALGEEDLSVYVGCGSSQARCRVTRPDEVRQLLDAILRARAAHPFVRVPDVTEADR